MAEQTFHSSFFLQLFKYLILSCGLKSQKNKPLVIQAEEGVGKKTLMVKWMEYHMANNKKVRINIWRSCR
jgi:hypothetical protein